MCRLNPKVDFAFKKLFGSEENKDILIAFVNSIIDENERIKDIILKNPYNIADYRKGKMTILDIKAVDEKEVWYDIEMQISQQDFFDKRALYYWSKVYSSQIESGEDYEKLRKTISINILDFNYLKEKEFHNEFKIYNTKTMKEFSNMFEMHFIELYENDLKALMDYRAQIKAAERSGIEEGIKEGIKKGEQQKEISIVKKLLLIGMDTEFISRASGLDAEKIEEIKRKLK